MPDTLFTRSRLTRAAAALLVAALAAGCTSTTETAQPRPTLSPGAGPLELRSVCPETVVVQSAWVPEAEHGALYHLLGKGYTIDAAKKRVTGPLVAQGKDTGVKIEIRAGGPAIGFQNAGTQMYADPAITLGQVATDDAIGLSANQAVVAVVSPFDIAPYMIMWDPKAHPDFRSIVDIGRTDTTVQYFKGATYMDYLTGSGILRKNQVDGSYDGSPARYVAESGKIAQQGFATNEPFIYEKVLPQWKRKVSFQLIHETGYPIYPESIVVRADRKDELAPCLEKLVPIIQRSQVEYVKDPVATNDVVVELVDQYKVGFSYSTEQAAFSVAQQLDLDIVGNGENETLGDFDTARVERVIGIVSPIYAGQRKQVKAGLKPADLVTNEFIDKSVGLEE
jgi:hypothetical protein